LLESHDGVGNGQLGGVFWIPRDFTNRSLYISSFRIPEFDKEEV